MTAQELLAELSRRDVHLEPRLRVDAPPGCLSEELRDALAEHKDEVIKLLIAQHHRDGAAKAKEATRTPGKHAGILW